jgi:hypothetical protein
MFHKLELKLETVDRRRTDNIMTKGKVRKGETILYIKTKDRATLKTEVNYSAPEW